jgi:acetyl-CoA carboxylase carboxyl transferase subunit alpha
MERHLEYEKTVIELEEKINDLKRFADEAGVDLSGEISRLQQKLNDKKDEIYSNISRWQRVELARISSRPTFLDYAGIIFKDFIELHGDRKFGDDKAIVCGIGLFEGTPVTVIGQQKGRNTAENIERNFGMPHPEGYRKALRHMKLAERFGRPVICFIDTSGAYPGIGAEERGQGQAIAENLLEMSSLTVPTISIVIGEGGSGGALALGVSNVVMMLENAIYSVISPEGFASIIYKDQSKVREAADALKLTAPDLLEMNVIDKIIKEPQGGAHKDVKVTAQNIVNQISCELKRLKTMDAEMLIEQRYNKFRSMGVYEETNVK